MDHSLNFTEMWVFVLTLRGVGMCDTYTVLERFREGS